MRLASLIYDMDAFLDFIMSYPPFGPRDPYSLMLVVMKRKKYGAEGDFLLKHVKLNRLDRDYISKKAFRELVALEDEVGQLVVYAPDGLVKDLSAAMCLAKELISALQNAVYPSVYGGGSLNHEELKKLKRAESVYRGCLMKSVKRLFIVVDLDDKGRLGDVLSEMRKEGVQILRVIETRGGFHIHIPAEEAGTFFKRVRQRVDVEVNRMTVPPGTLQAGFRVRVVEL